MKGWMTSGKAVEWDGRQGHSKFVPARLNLFRMACAGAVPLPDNQIQTESRRVNAGNIVIDCAPSWKDLVLVSFATSSSGQYQREIRHRSALIKPNLMVARFIRNDLLGPYCCHS